MTVTPVGSRVLVRLLPEQVVSQFIHVIKQDDLTQRAELLAVGPTVRDLAVGETVLVRVLAGMEIGAELLLPQESVIAKESE